MKTRFWEIMTDSAFLQLKNYFTVILSTGIMEDNSSK